MRNLHKCNRVKIEEDGGENSEDVSNEWMGRVSVG